MSKEYIEAVEIIDRVKDFRCVSEYYPMYEKTQYKVIFEVEENGIIQWK